MVVSWSLLVGLGLLVGAAVVSAATRYGRPIAVGSDEFLWPLGVAVDSSGDVFVSGAYSDVGGRIVRVVEVPVL